MRKLCLCLAMLGLTGVVVSTAQAFPPLPQCGPLPSCESGCYVPATEKCAQWAVDQTVDNGAVVCAAGSALGVCAP